jgi:hypothetical protein
MHTISRLKTIVTRIHARTLAAIALSLAALTPSTSTAQGGTSLSGNITDSQSGQPLAGAHVSLPGTTQGSVSRSDGSFRVPLAPGRHVVLVSYVGYAPIRDTIDVTAGQALVRNYSLTRAVAQLDPSVVIGTRTTDRTVLSSPVPVDVLTPAEIRQTGQAERGEDQEAALPDGFGRELQHADGDDVLVVRAVEDADHRARRHLRVYPPEEVVAQLELRRGLEA